MLIVPLDALIELFKPDRGRGVGELIDQARVEDGRAKDAST
jgi:hypothetical protein